MLAGWIWLLAAAAVSAQDAPLVPLGESVRGTLGNTAPTLSYRFEGRRGEFVSLLLTAESGNLDPVLSVLDADGNLLATGDDGNARGARIDSLRVPRSGVYTVVVSRFGGELGTTTGEFSLQMERIGVSSQSGSALRYGDTIINTISDDAPQHYYSFQAQRGDILNIQMQRISGNLDPLLQVVNGAGALIAENDDVPGSNTLDAQIERLVIEENGTYVIVATRYGAEAGESTGSFVLSLAESDDSGLGNTLQTAAPLTPGEPLENEITAARFEQFYTFNANENDLVRVTMDRVSGSLDAYLIIFDPNLQEITFDDDSGSGQNARVDDLRIPQDGRYIVKATRFNGTEGDTVGQYRVQLEQLGGAFDTAAPDALPILYDSTVTGVITDEQPAVTYAFYGNQGDVISVSMNRGDGDLDPVVSILGEQLQPLVTDDDSGSAQNARIGRYVLSRDGVYYVRARATPGRRGPATRAGATFWCWRSSPRHRWLLRFPRQVHDGVVAALGLPRNVLVVLEHKAIFFA